MFSYKYNGIYWNSSEDKVYDLKKLERNETISKDFDEIEIANKPKVKKKYILLWLMFGNISPL